MYVYHRLWAYQLKATHWSTNGDITDAHISATIQQILTKFSAVVSYVKQRQIGSFRVRSTNFLLNLRVTPPISMKFGTLADNA